MHWKSRSTVTHVLAEARLTPDARPALDAPLTPGIRHPHGTPRSHGEESAAGAAGRIAREHRAKLTLVHVLPEIAATPMDAPVGQMLRRARLARRRAAFDRLVALHPYEPRRNWLVVEGRSGVEIVQVAIRHAVDLILLDGARASPDAPADESAEMRYVIDRAPCRVELVGAGAAAAFPRRG